MEDNFDPDSFIALSEFITDIMKEKKLMLTHFIVEGFSEDDIFNLFSNKLIIDYETGEKLTKVLGGSPHFWVKRYDQYLDELKKL